jgi:hypothetical protein
MKVGDFVGKITNEWQRHNKWMDFGEEIEPLGIIVEKGKCGKQFWFVLLASGAVKELNENYLKVIAPGEGD